ncbi:hypothetical protein [Streptomyces armeniacus]|uniref:hypothetical protein n=1 Tax=Streptomyces armeniacus TaxID=83291 RepID=UPI001AD7FDCF|nr:hypothetical protein [Streptomyces armeniacus]
MLLEKVNSDQEVSGYLEAAGPVSGTTPVMDLTSVAYAIMEQYACMGSCLAAE